MIDRFVYLSAHFGFGHEMVEKWSSEPDLHDKIHIMDMKSVYISAQNMREIQSILKILYVCLFLITTKYLFLYIFIQQLSICDIIRIVKFYVNKPYTQ